MNYAIIAAGEGSRLAQEGVKQPKPLVPLNGEPMIKRLIDIFLQNNAQSISIIVNEEMTSVHDYLSHLQLPVPLHLVRQSTPSSMHSFALLKPYLAQGQFCLTTVDTIFHGNEFQGYIKYIENQSDADGVFAVTDYIDDEKPLHVAVDGDMNITNFLDATDMPRYVSGGIYSLKPDKAFDVLEQCLADNIFRMRNFQRALIQKGLQIKAYPFCKIVDVDHAGDIAKAEQFLLSK